MSIYPELIVGYQAASQALAKHAVSIRNPGVRSTFPMDPVEMLRAGPRAYSVEGTVLRNGINLCRTGRFGFDVEWLLVEFPVPYDAPDFAERLAAVLVPAVEGLLSRAMECFHSECSVLSPGAPVEAWEAVTRLEDGAP